jgi:hypothetical protein
MLLRIAFPAVLTIVLVPLLAGHALACDPGLRFKDKDTCLKNRDAIKAILEDRGFKAGFLTMNARNSYNDHKLSQCTTSTFCISRCAYVTMELFDGGPDLKEGRACEELKRIVNERKLLDVPVEPAKDARANPALEVTPWSESGAGVHSAE